MIKVHNRISIRMAATILAAFLIQITSGVEAQTLKPRGSWQSVILSSVGEGWSIDQGIAEVILSKSDFSAIFEQINPRTHSRYVFITLKGKIMIDKTTPGIKGVSGYAVKVVASYVNSDRSSFNMSGTYRKVMMSNGNYDEIIVLHEDYNVVTMSRRTIR